MRKACFAAVAATVVLLTAQAKSPFAGRWDLLVTTPTSSYPAWLEVVDQSGGPAVRFQPRGGFVRPASAAKLEGGQLIITISPATEDRPAITWECAVKNDLLTGSIHRAGEIQGRIAGVRAPELKNKPPKEWEAPESLFNGKDLTGWVPGSPAQSHWVVRDGELVNEEPGSNLRTTRKFDDFKLHLEFNCPEGGNSGIYLRGRYQLQIDYQPEGAANKLHGMGAIYGYVAPSKELPPKSGQWETLDITLIGRYVTVVRDGTTIIDKQEIAGITGGALDSNEVLPGPFNLQGTLGGGTRFRNITVSVPKK